LDSQKLNYEILKKYKYIETFPDYDGDSIVNLMQSIQTFFGVNSDSSYQNIEYQGLKFDIFNPNINSKASNIENVFLIIIDGLGYNYLNNSTLNLFLKRNIKTQLTSVVPPTTAAALTTFYTGLAPKNHGIPAWFTYLKEFGLISKVPPLTTREFNFKWIMNKSILKELFEFSSIFERIKARSYCLVPKYYLNTSYTSFLTSNSQMIGIENLEDLLEFGLNITQNIPGKKLLIGYWPNFDTSAHETGLYSERTLNELQSIDKIVENFISKSESKLQKTLFIITADHGFLDIETKNQIFIEKEFPEFKKFLTMPLCGEARLPFCYIRASKASEFMNFVTKNMNEICELISVDELINSNLLGYFKPHNKLFDRLGDFMLIMKNGFVLKDLILGGKESNENLKSYHGGLSTNEMIVPLIFW